MQCANHVKQLSLALHNYADAFTGAFPNDGWDDTTASFANLSVLVRILPYIEQQPLYSKFDFGVAYGTGKNTSGAGNAFEGTVTIKYFVCPSNSKSGPVNDGDVATTTLTNYVGIAGGTSYAADNTSQNYQNDVTLPTGTTDKAAAASYAHATPGYITNGVLLPLKSNTTFATMSDGTSNVFVFGEVTWPNADTDGYLTTESTWARGGTIPASSGGVKSYNVKAVSQLVGKVINSKYATPSNLGSIGSSHTGGVSIFGLGDGSVRAINDTTDGFVLERAANAKDGLSVSF
jgi:hypothetical protein